VTMRKPVRAESGGPRQALVPTQHVDHRARHSVPDPRRVVP
jgi:hypothetical protein